MTETITATVTPMDNQMQKIWRAMDELKPSDKGKITKADNKLRAEMAERNKPYQEAYRAMLDTYCPTRDEKIAEAKAKRDAIIKAAENEYQAARAQAQAEFEVHAKPVYDLQNKMWTEHYNIYKAQWLRLVESFVGRITL